MFSPQPYPLPLGEEAPIGHFRTFWWMKPRPASSLGAEVGKSRLKPRPRTQLRDTYRAPCPLGELTKISRHSRVRILRYVVSGGAFCAAVSIPEKVYERARSNFCRNPSIRSFLRHGVARGDTGRDSKPKPGTGWYAVDSKDECFITRRTMPSRHGL